MTEKERQEKEVEKESPPDKLTEVVEEAVRNAFRDIREEERRAERQKTLYNTRKLMESYTDLKKYIESAISEEEEIEDDRYMIFAGEKAHLRSVRESKMVTAMMVMNIDRALKETEEENIAKGTHYKYQAFRMRYIEGRTYEEITEQMNCGKNSPAAWSKQIMKQISVKLFGIHGI